MALKALLLKKKIDQLTKARKAMEPTLEELRKRSAEIETRAAELESAVNEMDENTSAEDTQTVTEEVEAFDQERREHEAKVTEAESEKEDLEKQIKDTEAELAELEEKQEDKPAEKEPEPEPEEKPAERKVEFKNMNFRKVFEKMNAEQRSAILGSENVKNWLGEYRSAIREKRAITGVGLTIPTEILPLLRENVQNWSKLYDSVNIQQVGGEARQPIMGTIPEAVWTECCANLNELALAFNDWTVDCYKVGGYFAVCKANAEDSDIDLLAAIVEALGQAIGKALDKAIIFGRNSATARKMPLGIFSRLAQTAEPDGYPATAREWEDLHETNIITIPATNKGAEFFQALIEAFGAASDEFASGDAVWCMNKKTRMKVVGKSLTINAAGAIVAGVQNQMPIVGGNIERLSFIPDNVIVAGYFEDYLLAERAGTKVSQSEHAQFIQDNTLFKGTARYDGMPVIPEAFVVIGIEGTTPDATAVTFPTGD